MKHCEAEPDKVQTVLCTTLVKNGTGLNIVGEDGCTASTYLTDHIPSLSYHNYLLSLTCCWWRMLRQCSRQVRVALDVAFSINISWDCNKSKQTVRKTSQDVIRSFSYSFYGKQLAYLTRYDLPAHSAISSSAYPYLIQGVNLLSCGR